MVSGEYENGVKMGNKPGSSLSEAQIQTILTTYAGNSSTKKTADMLGHSSCTVAKYVKIDQWWDSPEFKKVADEKAREFIAKAWGILFKAIDAMGGKIDAAGVGNLTTVVGVLFDKIMIASGKASAIIEQRDDRYPHKRPYEGLSSDELDNSLDLILEKARREGKQNKG